MKKERLRVLFSYVCEAEPCFHSYENGRAGAEGARQNMNTWNILSATCGHVCEAEQSLVRKRVYCFTLGV